MDLRRLYIFLLPPPHPSTIHQIIFSKCLNTLLNISRAFQSYSKAANMNKEDTNEMNHHESKSSSVNSLSFYTPPPPTGFLEKALKPLVYVPRYPRWMVGKPLLWATCFFGSLGDALFGYDQGIMSGLLVNEVFIKRFYSEHGGSEGSTDGVNPSLIGKITPIFFLVKYSFRYSGITVSCLQLSAAIGSLTAGYLGDIIGRKKCVRIGGFLYFAMAFLQGFAPNLACFIAGRTIQGLGVGFLSMTVPVIQTEIAAPHRVCLSHH